jgi:hypothetical protein
MIFASVRNFIFVEYDPDKSKHHLNDAGDHQPVRILELGEHAQLDALISLTSTRCAYWARSVL